MSEDIQKQLKISGYLEKKSKIKLKSWKKYWFVLEGRLLLYYRSKEEYESISPCKGSISLGPPCNMKPTMGMNYAFHIETRSNTIILRAADRVQQEKWIQAILSVLKQNSSSNDNRQIHFRYSNNDLPQQSSHHQKDSQFQRNSESSCDKKLLLRMQSIGAQSYGGSMGTIAKVSEAIKRPNLPQSRSLVKLLQNRNAHDVTFTSGDEMYAEVIKSKKPTRSKSEKRIESIMVENEQYITRKELMIESGDITRRKSSYAENIYERISQDSETWSDSRRSLIVDNDHYDVVIKANNANEYAIPITKKIEDHNKNSLVMENELYEGSAEDYNSVGEALYADPEEFFCKEDKEPAVPPRPIEKHEVSSTTPKKSSLAESLRNSAARVSKIWKRKTKTKKKNKNNAESTPPSNDHLNLEVLEELQKIMISKKNEIEVKLLKDIEKTKVSEEVNDGSQVAEMIVEEKEKEDQKENSHSDQKHRPQLPPHEPIKTTCSDYDVPKNNRPILNFLLPKKKNRKTQLLMNPDDKIKTIDEILDDLEKEETNAVEAHPTVRDLIGIFDDKKVTLRKKSPLLQQPESAFRHSGDLNDLLEELAKVTSAPIMIPGATISLNVTNTISDDWLNLKPLRYRRKSDPDYDIPRSLKPLHLLKDSGDNNNKPPESPSKREFQTSMDADSLEGLLLKTPKEEIGHNSATYTTDFQITFPPKNAHHKDEIIYAKPRLLLPVESGSNVRSLDVFIDSLEPCEETSTVF